MSKMSEIILQAVPNQGAANELMGRLFEAAKPSAVYSEPVQSGEYTVITASEVSVGLGFGYGGGGGVEQQAGEGSEDTSEPGGGYGSGGGGGGGASARPVAVIEIGPSGVRVEPVVDPTKIVLAFFTTIGSMFFMRRRMRRGR